MAQIGEYEKNVNNRLKAQGEEQDFKAQASNVIGERLSRSVAISKRGLPLLMFDSPYTKSATSIYLVRDNIGRLKEISEEEAKKYMPAPRPSHTGTGVKWRTYGIDKLVGIRVDNQEIINTDIDDDKIEVYEMVKDRLKK